MGRLAVTGGLVVLGLAAALSAQKPSTATGEVNLTATSANVGESGAPIKIHLLRWSTDEERNPMVAALNPPAPPAAAAAGGSPAGAGGNPPATAGAARGGRAAAARGRGGARGRGDAAPLSPIAAFTAALGRAPTLGYVWTNDVTGYSIKYAYRTALPGGGERIILATNRRLGADTAAWRPVGAAEVTDYEFTLFEIRLDPKGVGEGKASLVTKVAIDSEAKTVALEDYASAPAILRNVKR